MRKLILLYFFVFYFNPVFSQKSEFSPRILLGVSAMNAELSGDVRPVPTYFKNFALGIKGKLQFSKLFNAGVQINRGTTYGANTQPAIGYQFATNGTNPWKNNGYTSGVYYNYKMTFTRGGLSFGASSNANKRISIGVKPSVNILNFKTRVNALNNSNLKYDFSNFSTGNWDNTYESNAENESNSVLETNVETGITINVGKGLYAKIYLSVGFTNSDLLDGQQWQERNDFTQDKDNMFYTGLSIFYDFKLLNSK